MTFTCAHWKSKIFNVNIFGRRKLLYVKLFFKNILFSSCFGFTCYDFKKVIITATPQKRRTDYAI